MTITEPDLISTLLGEYRSHLRSLGASENTVRAYTSDVRTFLLWWGQDALAEPWEAMAPVWLNAARADGIGAATINRRATALRRWFDSRGGDRVNPLAKYKCPPAPVGEAHPLPGLMDDVRKMIAASEDPEIKLAIGLMGFAGLRVSEARSLHRVHVLPIPNQIKVVGKGGKTRYVPIAPELWVLFRPDGREGQWEDNDHLPFIKMTDRGLRLAVTRAGEKALIDRPVASHDLRMTFGTVVYNTTKDIRVVQELMGHSSSKTTERYTGVTEATKQSAIQEALG